MNHRTPVQIEATQLVSRKQDVEFRSTKLQWDTIHFAKEHVCTNPLYDGSAPTCIKCSLDCAFAGDDIAEHVYHNAEKVVMALSLGAIKSKRNAP